MGNVEFTLLKLVSLNVEDSLIRLEIIIAFKPFTGWFQQMSSLMQFLNQSLLWTCLHQNIRIQILNVFSILMSDIFLKSTLTQSRIWCLNLIKEIQSVTCNMSLISPMLYGETQNNALHQVYMQVFSLVIILLFRDNFNSYRKIFFKFR